MGVMRTACAFWQKQIANTTRSDGVAVRAEAVTNKPVNS